MADNFDSFSDFSAQEEPTVPADGPITPAVDPETGEVFDTDEGEENDFFADDEVEVPAFDVNSVITLRTSGGASYYVPTSEAMPMGDVIVKSGLMMSGVVTFWLNSSEIDKDTVVPAGSTVMLVGNVKGG